MLMRSGLGWVGDLRPLTLGGASGHGGNDGGGYRPPSLHLSSSMFLHDSAQTHQIVRRSDQ